MFEDPKWKPIYIKRQWHKRRRRRRKEQMTFNNKQELIDKIKEKKDSAKIAYEQTFNMQPCYETKEKQVKNKAYMEAYEDVIALIDSAKIVVYPEKTGKAPTTRNDELDARQYAVEGLNENQNLLKAYFGTTIKVHTKNRIVGSPTPFETIGKIVSDSGTFISIKQEDGGNVIILKGDIESIETIKEHEESKTLVDPLCNKCGKTKEECPFHRMGSAYEDCSGFIEQKPQRDDRFREFEIILTDIFGNKSKDCCTIDVKEIVLIKKDKTNNEIIFSNGKSLCLKKKKYNYNELVEWWKYWKQM